MMNIVVLGLLESQGWSDIGTVGSFSSIIAATCPRCEAMTTKKGQHVMCPTL